MGYKYRNGGTPDTVDSSQSNPTQPHLGVLPDTAKDPNYDLKRTFREAQAKGDTAKVRRMQDRVAPKPPVDTTALKGRMAKDAQTTNYNEIKGDDALRSQAPNKFDRSRELFKKADEASSSYLARADTLNQARKGKIPAK